jgi:diapolycopene oxygenase
VKNGKLRHILGFFAKYVGSSPYEAPGLLNLLAYAQFGYGLWYVQGGMYRLALALGRLLEELNVAVRLNSEVVEITKTGRTVTGIVLKDGTRHDASVIVSNMEVLPAYEQLLHEDRRFLRRCRKFEPSCSGLVLHLGVSRTYPRLAHHNFFFSSDPRRHYHEVFHRKILPEDPTLYVVAPAKTDPSQAPAGCENIKVLPHVPHLRDTAPFSRQAYLALRERILEKLERMGLPGLREHIVVEDLWTPEDLRNRYYSNKGAIYGVVADRFRNLGFKAPKKSTKYRNLYFAGGSVNPGGGMPMAVLSGMHVGDRIVRDRKRR